MSTFDLILGLQDPCVSLWLQDLMLFPIYMCLIKHIKVIRMGLCITVFPVGKIIEYRQKE